MKQAGSQEWLLLVHLLPQKPTKLRVHVWRRLQAIGALPIKNSVYVLPYSEKTSEDFQWLRQEIESSGGEANIFRAGSVEGATDKEIIDLFRAERDKGFNKLIAEFDGLSGAVREQAKGNSLSAGKLAQYHAESTKLKQELDRAEAIDFFQSQQASKARNAFERCRRELQSTESKSKGVNRRNADSAILRTADYQHRRWVTRKDAHIDRLASGWLIRRFIDQRPRFYFVSEVDRIDNALTFDMPDGNFSHRGDDCTFETMVKSFGLGSDDALREISEIVHDIDLKDDKFSRPEATGVNAVIDGLARVYGEDGERLKQCLPVFDALYKVFKKAPDARRAKRQRIKKKT